MRIRAPFVTVAACGLALLMTAAASGGAPSDRKADEDVQGDARVHSDADLPTDRPIVATVVEVDEDAGRVTLDTPHGQVALSVSQDLAGRLSPGDVVVLRLTDDDADFPSASPREEPEGPINPANPASPTKI